MIINWAKILELVIILPFEALVDKKRLERFQITITEL